MPVSSYPPRMPLDDLMIRHSREVEPRWANPIPFFPLVFLSTVLFLFGMWGFIYLTKMHTFANLSPRTASLLFSCAPSLLILLVIFLIPRFASPVWPYQVAIFQNPHERRLRWNLAVVATAYIMTGQIAQTEWLSLMPLLSQEERQKALGYIRRVRCFLEEVPMIVPVDLLVLVLAGLFVFSCALLGFHFQIFDAIISGIVLTGLLEAILLYSYFQRWQHIRRLIEVERVYEELMPTASSASSLSTPRILNGMSAEQVIFTDQQTTTNSVRIKPVAPWE